MPRIFHLSIAAAVVILHFVCADSAFAVMSGPCSGCHTMHNSQDNQPMRFDTQSEPLPQLLRGDCYGCHAQGRSDALVSVGIDVVPQVYHTDPAYDLAGGNFAYIDGTKGEAASDAKGHNIADLWGMGEDETLSTPPGGFTTSSSSTGDHPGDRINSSQLKCAGTTGCHGNRNSGISGYEGITGAHHNNANGSITQGTTDIEPGQGYRFLLGVNGYEDSDWQYNPSSTDHNEYAGKGTPIQFSGCWSPTACHGNGGVRPPRGTMAEYCATCHGNFHTLETNLGGGLSSGIGTGSSPFIRHPSDLSIPAVGEYATYTSYLTITPVARIELDYEAGPSDLVSPGRDAVFCLSCHVAHASPYPDMLKWDYATMEVGNGGDATGTGCFACHSAKD
jgi:Doubled CXXCH motif (Paired_CXXCH_1)